MLAPVSVYPRTSSRNPPKISEVHYLYRRFPSPSLAFRFRRTFTFSPVSTEILLLVTLLSCTRLTQMMASSSLEMCPYTTEVNADSFMCLPTPLGCSHASRCSFGQNILYPVRMSEVTVGTITASGYDFFSPSQPQQRKYSEHLHATNVENSWNPPGLLDGIQPYIRRPRRLFVPSSPGMLEVGIDNQQH